MSNIDNKCRERDTLQFVYMFPSSQRKNCLDKIFKIFYLWKEKYKIIEFVSEKNKITHIKTYDTVV